MRASEFLSESLLTRPPVLTVDISAYDLAKLMQRYRAEQASAESEIGDAAVVGFYSDIEREHFKKYLRSKGIPFKETGSNTEQ